MPDAEGRCDTKCNFFYVFIPLVFYTLYILWLFQIYLVLRVHVQVVCCSTSGHESCWHINAGTQTMRGDMFIIQIYVTTSCWRKLKGLKRPDVGCGCYRCFSEDIVFCWVYYCLGQVHVFTFTKSLDHSRCLQINKGYINWWRWLKLSSELTAMPNYSSCLLNYVLYYINEVR